MGVLVVWFWEGFVDVVIEVFVVREDDMVINIVELSNMVIISSCLKLICR